MFCVYASVKCYADADGSLGYKICSGHTFPLDTSYHLYADYVIQRWINDTPDKGYNYFFSYTVNDMKQFHMTTVTSA